MKPSTIYRKTMIFSWLKLGIGLMTAFVSLIIGAVAWLLITHVQFGTMLSVSIGCIAFLLAVVIYYLIMGRLGYSVKLGHLAIVERAYAGEDLPNNPVEFSKSVLSGRFRSARQYHWISRNLSLATQQIMRIISRGFSLETETPKISLGRVFLNIISAPAISCMSECCMAYALRRKDYEVNAACVDGLTILIQNWEKFRHQALKLSLFLIFAWLLLMALFFLPGFALAQTFSMSPIPWLVISFFLVLTSHVAFLDSWVLTKIVCEYLDIAQNAEIDSKNYTKLDSWSKWYAKIRKSAKKEAEKANVNNAPTAENLDAETSSAASQTAFAEAEIAPTAENLDAETSSAASQTDFAEAEIAPTAENIDATPRVAEDMPDETAQTASER